MPKSYLFNIDFSSKVEEYIKLTNNLNSESCLHFLIKLSDLRNATKSLNKTTIDMILKKTLLYSTRGLILCRGIDVYQSLGNPPTGPKTVVDNFKFNDDLELLFNKYKDNELFKQTFLIIPEKINTIYEEFEGPDDDWTNSYHTEFDFNTKYFNKYGIDISLCDPIINANMFEKDRYSDDDLSILNIWLPELKNVPIDILLKIREDEFDSFIRFQYALKKFIVDYSEVSSVDKLKEIFQYVDYEVRLFDSKIKQIRKSRALRAYEAAVGVITMGLCFALPLEITKLITAALGLYQGKEFIGSLFREKEKINTLKTSDFYVPWLCTKNKN